MGNPTIAWQRIAQLADQRLEVMPDAGTWGVYDQHLKTWLSHGWFYERDALLAQLDIVSEHPWELIVAWADEDGQPRSRDEDPDDCGPGCPECGNGW